MPPKNTTPLPCIGVTCLPSPTLTPPDPTPSLTCIRRVLHCFREVETVNCYVNAIKLPDNATASAATTQNAITQIQGAQSSSTSSLFPAIDTSSSKPDFHDHSSFAPLGVYSTRSSFTGASGFGLLSTGSANASTLAPTSTETESPGPTLVLRAPPLTDTSSLTLSAYPRISLSPGLLATPSDGVMPMPSLAPLMSTSTSYASSSTTFSLVLGMGVVAMLVVSMLCRFVAWRRQKKVGVGAHHCDNLFSEDSSIPGVEYNSWDGKGIFRVVSGVIRTQRDAA